MNINNVFIALTLDNEEILLYRVNTNKVINLKTEKEVKPSDIQLNSLVPYTRFTNSNRQLKATILRKYAKDRSKKLIVSNIFVGKIVITKERKFIETDTIKLSGHCSGVYHNVLFQIIKEKALLYRLSKGEELCSLDGMYLYDSEFVDLETQLKYKNENFKEVGGISIAPDMLPYLSVVGGYFDSLEEKGKVLKKYRERGK